LLGCGVANTLEFLDEAGGFKTQAISLVQRYSRALGTWSGATSLPGSRYRHSATLLGDDQTILWVGGADASTVLTSAYAYDTNSGTGVSSSMPAGNGRQAHTATFTGSKVLVVGGHNFNGATTFDTALLYTP